MSKKLFIGFAVVALAMFSISCATTDQTVNANANAANANAAANVNAATTTTRTAADGSEITTTTDANGVKTETRVFRNNPRVSKVVVTTRDGRRTVRAYSPSGQEKEVNDVGDALEVSGDKIADGAGWVAEKTVQGVSAAGRGLKTAGEKTAEGAKTVGEKTAEGAKTVGKTTATGAKKVGGAIKKAVTP